MGYEEALEAAGAEILEFEHFGSAQGDWFAQVRYQGKLGWVLGSYGSCSECDAFSHEFGYADDGCSSHRYYPKDDCEACQQVRRNHLKKLAEFGREYLSELYTQEEVEKYASRDIEWDMEAQQMLDWLKAHPLAANTDLAPHQTSPAQTSH